MRPPICLRGLDEEVRGAAAAPGRGLRDAPGELAERGVAGLQTEDEQYLLNYLKQKFQKKR